MPRQKFTDLWISSRPAPARGRIDYSDAICPGLQLRVTSRGVKTFSLIFRHGHMQRHTLGRYPLLGLAEARRQAMRLMREVAETEKTGKGSLLTFAEMVDSYVDLYLKRNIRSWANTRAILQQESLADFRKRRASSITKKDVVAILDLLVERGTPHAAVNLLGKLRAMFNWAVGRDMLVANPCLGIKPPAKTTQRDRVLTDAEIAAVWNACDKVAQPFGVMVRMLMLTGARRNEVAQMRRSELVGDIWTLPAQRSKSGRQNALPLPPTAMAILASLPDHGADSYVFSTTGGERPASNFAKNKSALDTASGRSGWTLHDLRRTARTKMSEIGVDRETARRIIGHAGDALDQTYDRATHEPAKRDALARLSAHLLDLTSNFTTAD